MSKNWNEDVPLEAIVKHLVKERDHYKDKLNKLVVYTKSLEKRLKNELTWQDAQDLHIITMQYMEELKHGGVEKYPSSSQKMFEEILRRFKEAKSCGSH